MDWKKLVASVVWIAGVGALDVAYIWSHGVDITSILTGIAALFPAWAFIAKDVDFSLLGGKFHISGADLAAAGAELTTSGPAAIEQARKLPELPPAKRPEDVAVHELYTYLDRVSAETAEQWAAAPRPAEDPNLSLVSLRIEIERRVNVIAQLVDLPPSRSLLQMIKALRTKEVFPPEFADGLERLVRYGNAAAHGAKVEPGTAFSISILSEDALNTLDDIIGELRRKK